MKFTPKPHVSAALRHLRFSVSTTALTLCVCIILQMLVFAFVHFTEARWTTIEADESHAAAVVVQPTAATSAPPRANAPAAATGQPARTVEPPANPPDPNRVLGRNDRWFSLISALAQSIGCVAAVVLAVLMFQGVSVGAGASVPGIERAVTASTWSIAIALFCLPLTDILPSLPYSGVFSPYAALAGESDALHGWNENTPPSSFRFFAQHLIIPLTTLAAVAVVVFRFSAGIEQGAIVTSVSELDEKLEREMQSIKLGATSAPRTIGALNRAIGDDVVSDVAPSLKRGASGGGPSSNGGGAPSAPLRVKDNPMRRLKETDPGDPLSRPI